MPNHSSNHDELTEHLDRLLYNSSLLNFILSEFKAELEITMLSDRDHHVSTSAIKSQKSKVLNVLSSILNDAMSRDPSLDNQDHGEPKAVTQIEPEKELMLKINYLERIIISINMQVNIVGNALEELTQVD